MTSLSSLEDHIPALRRYAWSLLRNASDADDLVQDCLLRALDRFDTRVSQGDIRPWLFTIMHNIYIDDWRRLRLRNQVMIEGVEADLGLPPAQQANTEIRDTLRALAALPEEQRQVLLLVAVEGFGYGDAAAILGLPVGTVMSRLSRAREKLRELAEGRERPVLRRVK
jgi:RNA polymerase sigma-70 factor (ECF subfamily)